MTKARTPTAILVRLVLVSSCLALLLAGCSPMSNDTAGERRKNMVAELYKTRPPSHLIDELDFDLKAFLLEVGQESLALRLDPAIRLGVFEDSPPHWPIAPPALIRADMAQGGLYKPLTPPWPAGTARSWQAFSLGDSVGTPLFSTKDFQNQCVTVAPDRLRGADKNMLPCVAHTSKSNLFVVFELPSTLKPLIPVIFDKVGMMSESRHGGEL